MLLALHTLIDFLAFAFTGAFFALHIFLVCVGRVAGCAHVAVSAQVGLIFAQNALTLVTLLGNVEFANLVCTGQALCLPADWFVLLAF